MLISAVNVIVRSIRATVAVFVIAVGIVNVSISAVHVKKIVAVNANATVTGHVNVII